MKGEIQAREELERRHGDVLTAMQRLRDRAVGDLAGGRPKEGIDIALLAIAAKAIDVFDSVRLLIEAGKASEALATSRTLYDLDLDAHLLSHSGHRDLLLRYSSFEILEKGQLLTKLRELRAEEANERASQVLQWMKDAIEMSGKEVPDGFNDLSLREACERFGKLIFGSRYPSSWRWGLKGERLYQWWAESESEAQGNDLEAAALADRSRQLRRDGELIYSIMSARIHGSPASANELVKIEEGNVQLLLPAPVANLIPLICDVATVHFVRLHRRVAQRLDLKRDEESWQADLSLVQPR